MEGPKIMSANLPKNRLNPGVKARTVFFYEWKTNNPGLNLYYVCRLDNRYNIRNTVKTTVELYRSVLIAQ